MNRNRTLLVLAVVAMFVFCIATLVTANSATASVPSDASSAKGTHYPNRPQRACPTEDSVYWCVWDAKHRGNGEGRSFWVSGFRKDTSVRIHFISHRTAHRLIHGAR